MMTECELVVGSETLLHGDRIVACRLVGENDKQWADWTGDGITVGAGKYKNFDWAGNYPGKRFEFKVRRKMWVTAQPTVQGVANLTNDAFPHKCPRCGGAAYIGLASVDCEKRCG